jgi:hypothetical protein
VASRAPLNHFAISLSLSLVGRAAIVSLYTETSRPSPIVHLPPSPSLLPIMTYNDYYVPAVALLAFIFIARSLASYIATLRFKKAHGCKPPNKIPQFERILGLGLYKEQSEAQKNKRIMETSRKRFADIGNTWSATMLGQTFFNTIEPENIKTILATNFKDYGLGGRLRAFGPLLGRGIFTSDGTAWEHSRVCDINPCFALNPNYDHRHWSDQTLLGRKWQIWIRSRPTSTT